MRTAAERGAKLTQQLLAFSRPQRLEPKPLDLNEAVESMRDLLQSSLGGSVQIETRLRPGLWLALVDPTQIELAVLNLAINARDAMQVGGRLTVETANVTVAAPERPEEPAAGDYVMIAVNDTGSGMSKHVLAKAFGPFFTTKDVGKGSGLGLSQVLGFALGGVLSLRSDDIARGGEPAGFARGCGLPSAVITFHSESRRTTLPSGLQSGLTPRSRVPGGRPFQNC